MRYELTLKADVSCANEAAAKQAMAKLQKFLSNPLVTGALQAEGVQLTATPTISIALKK